MKRLLLGLLVFTGFLLVESCNTDIPRLTIYRDRIWKIVEKFDQLSVQISDLVENRADYATYRAIQLSEDITNQIAYTSEELNGTSPPDSARPGNDLLLEAGQTLSQASSATEAFAADPNDKAKHDLALLYIRSYHNQRDIAVNRIAKAMEAAGLVAHPPEPPIPNTSKVPPADAHILLE